MTDRYEWMTEDQRACFALLVDLMKGPHHVQPVTETKCGEGIECGILESVSTFDGDLMTRLVLMAHDRGIRAEVVARGRRNLVLILHRRKRTGHIYDRHPTLEQAVESHRKAGFTEVEVPNR